jgi:hypothetical protein
MSSNPTTRTRKANAGSFKPGPDTRRHKFTREECSRGFWTAIAVWGVTIGQKLHASGRWQGFQPKQGRRASR